MSGEFSPELRRELLDDFYAECDELLAALREGLTQLETSVEKNRSDARVVEGLFRTTHSLKGISAIVGLRPAEELAHRMEDILRLLSKGAIRASAELVDAMLAGAQRLEKIVAAHRGSKASPPTQDVLDQLHAWMPSETPAGNEPVAKSEPTELPLASPLKDAQARGLILFRATFSPSAERDGRGLNVTSVRERLSSLGEIISAVPIVRGKGVIVFEFVVGVKQVPAGGGPGLEEGVEWAPWEASPASLAPAVAAPAVPAAAEDISETGSVTPSHVVRVDLARLDDLMRIAGEMVIQRSRLEERLQQKEDGRGGLAEINRALGRSLREMRTAIARVRMVPIAEIFTRMPFVVRDLVRETEKKVRVTLEGNQTEVDKYLVERLKEPLLHLVRNAVAHGIESAGERAAAKKPAEATIALQARSVGEFVVIEIRDDGRGVDPEVIKARAKALGLAVPARFDAGDVLTVLCTPGFSTRDQADRAAGRGVGMDVVAKTVRELGGTVVLESELGVGSRFTLKLPLTLSIADAIIVSVGAEMCAVPQNAVNEIIQVEADTTRLIQTTETIPYRGGLLPLVRLRKLFGVAANDATLLTVLVVSSERGATGLVVDAVRSQREIVVRPLSDPLLRVPGISGATELGDGRPILILDPNAITQGVVRPPSTSVRAPAQLSSISTT